ncbi:hypothetical protein FRC02_003706 [Tulasnella sp. 418]|nr:hypothetical protein FRC02_003706 [Tulasnella sp. 418]
MLGTDLWEDCSGGLIPDDQDHRQVKVTITEKQKTDAIRDAKERRERRLLERLRDPDADDLVM